MTNLEWATWGLTIFTGALMVATFIYAFIAFKMLQSSGLSQKLLEEQNLIAERQNELLKEQIKESQNQATALNELSSNLVKLTLEMGNLPYTEEHIRRNKEIKKEIAEIQNKNNPQRRALTGHR